MHRVSQPLEDAILALGECIFCNRKKRQVEAENNDKVVDTNKCETEGESGNRSWSGKVFSGCRRTTLLIIKTLPSCNNNNNNNVPEFHFLSLSSEICEKFECIVLSCSYSLARRERSKNERRRN